MAALSTEQITAINQTGVTHALTVHVSFGTNNLYLTDYYRNLLIDGNTYVGDSEIQPLTSTRTSTSSNNATTRVRLGLLDPTRRQFFLSDDVIGADVTISRILIDANGDVIGDPIPRIIGKEFAYEIRDDYTGDGTLQRFEAIIDIRPDTADLQTTPNVRTNSNSQHRFAPTDNIFSLVEGSAGKRIQLF